MSEYKRFIAYVYEYMQEQKGSNRGFIKVEARNGVCKMDFHLTGIQGQDKCKIYAYAREGKECRAIFLGACAPKSDKLECRVQTGEDQIGKTSYKLGDLGGIILLGEGQRMYGTEWDDIPIRIQEFSFTWQEHEEALSPQRADQQAVEEKPSDTSGSENQQKEGEGATEQPVQEETIEEAAEAVVQEQSLAKEKVQESGEAAETRKPELTIEEIQQMEDIRQLKEEKEEFRPFCDQDMMECYKITPRDLERISRRDQALVNNNFLTHGYYNYHHLLFGREKETKQYILGVPGIYDHQEKFMAVMFGFPNFKAASLPEEEEAASQMGQFGYWYRLIDTPDLYQGDSF